MVLCSDGRSCRKTVQGHIDQHRITARSRGSGRSFETLPLRAPGIVDMHVGIDEPGKDGCISEVMNLVTGGYLIGRDNALNPFFFYQYRRRTNSFGSDDATRNEGLQTQNGTPSANRAGQSICRQSSDPAIRTTQESNPHFTKFQVPAYTRFSAKRAREESKSPAGYWRRINLDHDRKK